MQVISLCYLINFTNEITILIVVCYFILGICICALSFITFVVPETKGKNPKDFMQNEGVNIYSPLTASELS